MILCLDVGNTQIHGGVFEGDQLKMQFRRTSQFKGSSDETGLFLRSVLRENDVDPSSIHQVGILLGGARCRALHSQCLCKIF